MRWFAAGRVEGNSRLVPFVTSWFNPIAGYSSTLAPAVATVAKTAGSLRKRSG